MTRSKPRMAMEMSFVRIRRWWVSQSQPPLMVSSSTPCASRSCRSMTSTSHRAEVVFQRTDSDAPVRRHHATYLRRKVVFPAPENPVIKSTCTIFRPSVGFFFRCQYKRTRPDCQTEKTALSRSGKGPFRRNAGSSLQEFDAAVLDVVHRTDDPQARSPPRCYGCTGSFRSPAHCAGH